MKLAVVARQVPDRRGTAAGRALFAWCEGAIAEGHELEVWSWSPEEPRDELPRWCVWRPLPEESWVMTRGRAIARPRADVLGANWHAPDDAIAVADDVPSFAAVARHRRSVATLHFRAGIDAAALGRRSLRDLQDRRAERRAAGTAWMTLAYSARAGAAARGSGRIVPIAYATPEHALAFVEDPIVALLADWRWPANRGALATLLRIWPDVTRRVRGARLLLAGRGGGCISVGTSRDVEWLGEVGDTLEVLGRTALVAFPCPPTSGPKVKVLEALAHGVAAVTTPAGVEGLFVGDVAGEIVAREPEMAARMVELLTDPGRRAALAARARAAVVATHAPGPAARTRVQALEWALTRDAASPKGSR